MKLEHILLGLLGEMPRTGYEIKRFLDVRGRFLRANTTMSQVYRSLSSMTNHGWVAYSVDKRPGAQDAKIYRVTPEGMTVLREWLEGPYVPPIRFQDSELSARLAFAGYLTPEQVVALIDIELTARREQVAKYRFRDRTIEVDPNVDFDRALSTAVSERLHEHGTKAVDLHIAGLEDLRRDLLDGSLLASSASGSANPASQRAGDATS